MDGGSLEDVGEASSTSMYLLFQLDGPPEGFPKIREIGDAQYLDVTWVWYFDYNGAALESEPEDIQALYWKSKDAHEYFEDLTDLEQPAAELSRASTATLPLSEGSFQSQESTRAIGKSGDQETGGASYRGASIHTFQPAPGMVEIWKEIGHPVPQDIEDRTRPQHFTFSFAPSETVNLALLGDVVVTCVELLTVSLPVRRKFAHTCDR